MLGRWRADAVNLVALTCLQASNAVIPLLIVPIAIARLGPAGYAGVAIAEAVSMIAVAVVLYSFEIDGVARITGLKLAEHRDEMSDALSAILAARLLLLAGAAAVLLAGFALLSSLPLALLAYWLLVPLGYALHSYWFYQGFERNIAPAALTLVARLSSLLLVLLFVRSPADRELVPLAIGGPFAAAGLASLAYKFVAYGLRPRWAGLRLVSEYLRHGRQIFAGTGAVMLYREINVLLMGVAGVPAAAIGSYALVEKSIKMIQAVTRPLNQLFFPKVLRALQGRARPDPDAARVIGRFTAPQLAAVTAVLLVLWLGYDRLLPYSATLRQFGELPEVATLFAIVAPAPLLGLANFMWGSAGLNFLNDRAYLLRAILVTGVVSVPACLLLSGLFGATGAAICFVGAEALLLVMIMYRYRGARPLITNAEVAS